MLANKIMNVQSSHVQIPTKNIQMIAIIINNIIIWLVPRAGKMNQIARCEFGYPSGQDGAILPAQDYPLYPASKIPPKAI